MKKWIAFIGIAALSLSLAACGGGESKAESQGTAASSSQAASEEKVGGWTLNSEMKGSLPAEAQSAFDKAMEDYKDVKLEAVDYLGSQVVSGTNHMILCKSSDPAGLKVAVIYENLEGKATVSGITDFDIAAYSQAEDKGAGEQGLSGGWTVYADQPSASLPADVKTAFDTAMEGLTGASYDPAVLLGSQIVSGNNYAILCKQTLVTANPVTNLAMVYIYVPLTGEAEIMNIYALDLAEYNK